MRDRKTVKYDRKSNIGALKSQVDKCQGKTLKPYTNISSKNFVVATKTAELRAMLAV